jgi:hypothetical protein
MKELDMPNITPTTTNQAPTGVEPLSGAAIVDDWQPGPRPYRVILGRTRVVGPKTLAQVGGESP